MMKKLALPFLIILLCSACGAKIIRGASPIVRMNELSQQDDHIRLGLSMRNLNGVELNIRNIDFSLSVEEEQLFSYTGPADTDITANGIETWTIDLEDSDKGRDLLEQLQNGDIKSLPYSLEGSVTTVEDGALRFEYDGHIYPVPGKPGYFR